MTIYKGEMDLNYFLRSIPYKDMMLLRDIRIQQLTAEKEELSKMESDKEHERFIKDFTS